MKEITDCNFDEAVLVSDHPVLVDFWAPWCVPCRAMMPVLEAMSRDYEGVSFVKVNVDENVSMRERFGIRGIPALILFAGGKEIVRFAGVQSRTKLTTVLDEHTGRKTEVAVEATPRSAFGGSEEVKRACIGKLMAHQAAGTVRPGGTFWDGTVGSEIGCAVEHSDERTRSQILGLPTSVISLADVLSTYHGTVTGANAFAMQWMTSIRPGADYSKLATELLIKVLQSEQFSGLLEGDEELTAIRNRVAGLHMQELADGAKSGDSWASTRQIANELAKSADTALHRELAGSLSEACLTITREPEVAAQFVSKVGVIVMNQAMRALNWLPEDENRAMEHFKRIAEAAASNGEGSQKVDVSARFSEEEPELAARFKEQYEARGLATKQWGTYVSDVLLELTAMAQ